MYIYPHVTVESCKLVRMGRGQVIRRFEAKICFNDLKRWECWINSAYKGELYVVNDKDMHEHIGAGVAG